MSPWPISGGCDIDREAQRDLYLVSWGLKGKYSRLCFYASVREVVSTVQITFPAPRDGKHEALLSRKIVRICRDGLRGFRALSQPNVLS